MKTWIFIIGFALLIGLAGCQKAEKTTGNTLPAQVTQKPKPTYTITPMQPDTAPAPAPAVAQPATPAPTPVAPAISTIPTTAAATSSNPGNAQSPVITRANPPAPPVSLIKTTPDTEFLLDRSLGLYMATAGRDFGKSAYANTIMSDRYKESTGPRNIAYQDVVACTTTNEFALESAIHTINKKLNDQRYAEDLAIIRGSFNSWKQQNNRSTYR